MSGNESAMQVSPGGGVPESRWTKAAEYGGAAVLAWVAVYFGFHSAAFQDTRFVLSFCVVALAALTGGMGPAITAIVVTFAAAHQYSNSALRPGPLTLARVVSVGTLGLAVGLLLIVIHRRVAGERRLRELVQRLKEQAEALTRAQQASRSAAWTYDVSTDRVHWYKGAADVFGRPQEEIAAMESPATLVLEEDRGKIAEAMDHTRRTGAPFVVDFRVLWPSGELHWLEARGIPLESDPKIWRGATVDITERKRAELALLQSEKLAIAGRLAASIAHEINNPLEAVTNLCYLARATSTSEESARYIAMAEEELSRIAQITSQTLRFHRQQTAATDTDLAELAGSVLALYEQKLTERGIRWRLEVKPVAPLRCYAGEIRQVLANLVGNAIDAMPGGGTLRVSVRCLNDPKTAAPAVRISVADTGHGIPGETRRRIFEPFYTTKGELGTGLGLWVSLTLLEKHRGRLMVRSSTAPGRSGTVFSIVLPYPAPSGRD